MAASQASLGACVMPAISRKTVSPPPLIQQHANAALCLFAQPRAGGGVSFLPAECPTNPSTSLRGMVIPYGPYRMGGALPTALIGPYRVCGYTHVLARVPLGVCTLGCY